MAMSGDDELKEWTAEFQDFEQAADAIADVVEPFYPPIGILKLVVKVVCILGVAWAKIVIRSWKRTSTSR